MLVVRRNLDGRVCSACRRAADHEWDLKALARHFAGDVCHFFERRCDQTRKTDDLCLVFDRRFENLVAWHHDAEVDDFVAITAEYHADDVFADVVYIALHRGDNDLALGGSTRACLFCLDKRHQMSDRLLHDARRLDHLRQEHLAGAEQVADGIHARHQRPLDDGERRLALGGQRSTTLFGIRHHVFGNTLDHGVT